MNRILGVDKALQSSLPEAARQIGEQLPEAAAQLSKGMPEALVKAAASLGESLNRGNVRVLLNNEQDYELKSIYYAIADMPKALVDAAKVLADSSSKDLSQALIEGAKSLGESLGKSIGQQHLLSQQRVPNRLDYIQTTATCVAAAGIFIAGVAYAWSVWNNRNNDTGKDIENQILH